MTNNAELHIPHSSKREFLSTNKMSNVLGILVKPALLLSLIVLLSCSCATTEIAEIDFNSFQNPALESIAEHKHSITERLEHYNIPGASIAVVQNGKVEWSRGYGIANTINSAKVSANTLFQAGSISKPIAALAVLKLEAEGKVNLDEDVNQYLKGWKIPENKYTENEKVTLRRLLTHTAGTTVHGFRGYKQKEQIPIIDDILNGKGNSPKVVVKTVPGSSYKYSGGGYTILEKVVEDVSGLPFEEYMDINILKPLEMDSSTFSQPLPKKLHHLASAAHKSNGKVYEGLWNNYPEQAAAGLWTTPTDLAKYMAHIHQAYFERSRTFVTKKMVEKMLEPDPNNRGLGLSVAKSDNLLVYQHGGTNLGFNSMLGAMLEPESQGIIIMTNSNNNFGRLAQEIIQSVGQHYGWHLNSTNLR